MSSAARLYELHELFCPRLFFFFFTPLYHCLSPKESGVVFMAAGRLPFSLQIKCTKEECMCAAVPNDFLKDGMMCGRQRKDDPNQTLQFL
jgi:hypothetical protein